MWSCRIIRTFHSGCQARHGSWLKYDVDNDRDMVAKTRTAPVLERAYDQFADSPEPLRRQKHVIDVIRGTVLLAIAPIEGRHRLLALRLAPQDVVGAGEAQPLQGGDRAGVIDAPAGLVPVDIVIEIPGDDARSFGKEVSVFGERPAQRAELVLPAHA